MEKEDLTTETVGRLSKDPGYSSQEPSMKDLRSQAEVSSVNFERQEAMVNEAMYPSNRSNHSFLQEC